MKMSSFLFIAVPVLMLLSCAKPTSESETKRWDSNQKTLNTLTAKYPNFRGALDIVQAEAAQQWEAALMVTEEEQKIAAMQTANTAAYPEFVRQLDGMENKLEALKSLCTKSTRNAVQTMDKESLRIARNNAQRTLSAMEYLLKNSTANTPVEATVLTNEASKKIKNANSNIQKVLKRISEKARAKKQQEKAQKDEQNAATKSKKPVKCSYCGVKNSPSTSKCKGCGAPVK